MNDDLIALRIPSSIKKDLENKHPEAKLRNNVIRALLQKYLAGKIEITSYEIRLTV